MTPTPSPHQPSGASFNRGASRQEFSTWEECYGDSWKGIITNESFAHPAKFSKALIERIFDYCLERGWLKRGDHVSDPFGGIGNGGIIAAYRGLNWTGVELEPRFVKFANDNFALHADHWRALGLPMPRIVQGDSRRFHQVVSCAGVVTSPPFSESLSAGFEDRPGLVFGNARHGHKDNRTQESQTYGDSPGQIGRLKSGDVSAVITSPPYAKAIHAGNGIDAEKLTGNASGKNSQAHAEGYGNAPGQIAGLNEGTVEAVITSPPFSAPNMQPKIGAQGIRKTHGDCRDGYAGDRNDANIETLQPGNVDAVVTSPPFENQEGAMKASKFKFIPDNGKGHYASPEAKAAALERAQSQEYGNSEGQIGNEQKETYWAAMLEVYASCYAAIKPGGVLVCVVKDYVSKGKRVPLCDDTARLLEHCGFTVIERVHAMLTKETRHGDLFNGETVTTKSRKSFFRRLAEKKGSPPIDYEEVIFCQKPL